MNAELKQITPSMVCLAATTLILAEGSTSSLIVKQFLRNRGYKARQADVSTWLFDVAQQQGWAINDNGIFKVYYFPTLGAFLQ
ncbi:hypothetical protein [Spirosoma sp.]|uniref:hypothetical protein n=1 Tax=Spirosoma sp. TaxID=1899569 RepID=UPI003B3A64EE